METGSREAVIYQIKKLYFSGFELLDELLHFVEEKYNIELDFDWRYSFCIYSHSFED